MSAVSWRIALVAALLAATCTSFAVEPGTAAPGFRLQPFSPAQPVSVADYKGNVVLVDFWASWCSPCRQSLPLYDELRAEFPPVDFDILAVSLDEDIADAKTFLAEHPVKYTTLQNPQDDIAKAYDLKGMPSSYLIDCDGIVRARHVGFTPADIDALRSEVTALIGKPAHAP